MGVPEKIVEDGASEASEEIDSEAGQSGEEGEEEAPEEEMELEEGDIEAMARATLKPGESILGEGVAANEVQSRGVCLVDRLNQITEDLAYKVPKDAKRVPWVDTMCIDGQTRLPKGLGPKAGVKLEAEFIGMAGDAVKEAYRRLRVMKIPLSRPPDFYAEMLKTDKQMYHIRQRASEELRRIRIVEARKKNQAAKKFSKKARTTKLKARADDKQQLLSDVAEWRKDKNKNNKDGESRGLDEILDDKKRAEKAEKRDNHGNLVKGKKREFYDQKYGSGGKKKYAKSNTKESVDDFSQSPWSKGGKGKGKGKGGKAGGGKSGGGKGKRKGGGGKSGGKGKKGKK